jgi:hypothetical protein
VSPKRCRGRVPDRATFKTTSGAMVATLRFSRALPFVWLCLSLRVHQNLELFKPLDATFAALSFHPGSKYRFFGFFG